MRSVSSIRLLLVDDERVVREGLRMRLALTHDISVVGEADSARTAVEQVRTLQPDVVVLDVNLPDMNGVETCALIRSRAVAVVMLSIEDSEDLRTRCAAAGAAAFVSKQDPAGALLEAIRRAALSTRA